MLTHYIEYRVVERQEAAHLLGLAFHAVHGYLSRHGLDSVGISLPDARFEPPPRPEEGEAPPRPGPPAHPHPGGRLRVFAPDEAILRGLMDWEGLARLVAMGAMLATGIRAVPSEPEGHCLWRRTRHPERQTGAYILRSEDRFVRRLASRGVDKAETDRHIDARRAKLLLRQKNPPPALFLRSSSKSTACRLSLFIERIDRDSPATGPFNHYGLSQAATVPVF